MEQYCLNMASGLVLRDPLRIGMDLQLKIHTRTLSLRNEICTLLGSQTQMDGLSGV